MMSFTRNLATAPFARLFSTTVARHAYYTSSLVTDQVVKTDPHAKLYDFRSDTVTAPTDEMFDIMKAASRNDDVFQVRKKNAYMPYGTCTFRMNYRFIYFFFSVNRKTSL
jgi:threonine aldolase